MGWLEELKGKLDVIYKYAGSGQMAGSDEIEDVSRGIDRLIAIAELDGRDCCCPGLRRKISYAKDDYESHTHLIICPHHEDWKP